MKYFLDTEFHEYTVTDLFHKQVPTIELISIGIVAEDGREYYRISNSFNIDSALYNEWLRVNVIYPIIASLAPEKDAPEYRPEFTYNAYHYVADALSLQNSSTTNTKIAEEITEFIGDDKKPEFYGYYADYDWVVFCWLFGRMIDLPRNFPMYCRDLKQMLDEKISAKHLKELHSRGHSSISLEKVKSMPEFPKQENEHNALADARWNKELYKFVKWL